MTKSSTLSTVHRLIKLATTSPAMKNDADDSPACDFLFWRNNDPALLNQKPSGAEHGLLNEEENRKALPSIPPTVRSENDSFLKTNDVEEDSDLQKNERMANDVECSITEGSTPTSNLDNLGHTVVQVLPPPNSNDGNRGTSTDCLNLSSAQMQQTSADQEPIHQLSAAPASSASSIPSLTSTSVSINRSKSLPGMTTNKNISPRRIIFPSLHQRNMFAKNSEEARPPQQEPQTLRKSLPQCHQSIKSAGEHPALAQKVSNGSASFTASSTTSVPDFSSFASTVPLHRRDLSLRRDYLWDKTNNDTVNFSPIGDDVSEGTALVGSRKAPAIKFDCSSLVIPPFKGKEPKRFPESDSFKAGPTNASSIAQSGSTLDDTHLSLQESAAAIPDKNKGLPDQSYFPNRISPHCYNSISDDDKITKLAAPQAALAGEKGPVLSLPMPKISVPGQSFAHLKPQPGPSILRRGRSDPTSKQNRTTSFGATKEKKLRLPHAPPLARIPSGISWTEDDDEEGKNTTVDASLVDNVDGTLNANHFYGRRNTVPSDFSTSLSDSSMRKSQSENSITSSIEEERRIHANKLSRSLEISNDTIEVDNIATNAERKDNTTDNDEGGFVQRHNNTNPSVFKNTNRSSITSNTSSTGPASRITRHTSIEELSPKQIHFDPRVWVFEYAKNKEENNWFSLDELERFKCNAVARIQRRYSMDMLQNGSGSVDESRGGGFMRRRSSDGRKNVMKALFTDPALSSVEEDDSDEGEQPVLTSVNSGDFKKFGFRDFGSSQSLSVMIAQSTKARKHHYVRDQHTWGTEGQGVRGSFVRISAKEQKLHNLMIEVMRSVLIVDPHDIFLGLFTKGIKAMLPHATVTTAHTVEEAYRKIFEARVESPLSDGGCTHGFDLIIAEERLMLFHRFSQSVEKEQLQNQKQSLPTSGSGFIARVVSEEKTMAATWNKSSMGRKVHPRYALLVGMSAHIEQDKQVMEKSGADFVWGKPPPPMHSTLRNELLKLLLAKRDIRGMEDLFK